MAHTYSIPISILSLKQRTVAQRITPFLLLLIKKGWPLSLTNEERRREEDKRTGDELMEAREGNGKEGIRRRTEQS